MVPFRFRTVCDFSSVHAVVRFVHGRAGEEVLKQEGFVMIHVNDVFHHYGLRPTLEDISFTVESGRTLAIIGPNGTGKTTLLKLLAGLASPAEGTIEFNGRVRRSTVENEIAVRQETVFQPAELWFPSAVTGRQYVLAVAELWGVPIRRAFSHLEKLFTVFHLDEIADSNIAGYSSGQQKKISLCSALICEASILLLDEPFSGGLDPAGLTAMKQILKHLSERKDRTVILTSPVPELVEEVADDVLVLKEGRVLRHDSVAGLKTEFEVPTLDLALRKLIFPETSNDLDEYLNGEVMR